jgi:predicted adenylyl cyclase CyaB
MGAKRIASGLELNEFYDRGDFLKKQKVALRLRRFGKPPALLTLKGPRIRNKFTKRMEIETPIAYKTAKGILDFLGCRVVRKYSKRRELYRLGMVHVTVDFLKQFGWFLEIEGRPQGIRKIEKKLGLTGADREERSYLQMMFGWKH